jgi:hypothetical protein
MPLGKSPILQNDLMAEGDNQKFLLFNDALVKLEDSVNRAVVIDMTAGDYGLSETQLLHHAVFQCSGHAVETKLIIPVSVGSPPITTNRQIAVVNNGTASVLITHNAAGDDVTVAAGSTAVVYADGSDVVSLGGAASTATTVAVSVDGTEVLAAVTDINFVGMNVADDTDGTVTITFVYNGAAIKSAYEAEANTNAYTDAEKTKLAGIEGSLFLGTFVSEAALTTAHAAPVVGSYAFVDTGVSTDVQMYIWDDTDAAYVVSTGGGTETASSIKTKYESNADTNAFTDAEKAKLTGVETGATAGGGGGGGAIAVNDEGVAVVAAATSINFVGENVTVTDVAGVATVTIATPTPPSLYAAFDAADLTNVQAVFGGGMILRNSAYTGPALRVANNLNTDEIDVAFDVFGRVSGARPYGDDTRLITVYDQWGTDHMTALKTVGITLLEEDADSGFYTWQINFGTASDGLYTASTAADNPAWEQEHPLWAFGHKRVSNGSLLCMQGTGSGANFMATGVWQEGADLHWRVDSSTQTDWNITDWVADAPASQNYARAIGDMTQRTSIANAYFNGAAAGVRSYAGTVDNYRSTTRYGWGNAEFGVGNPFDGLSSELHVFGSSAEATAGEIAFIDTAMAEVQTVTEFTATAGGGASRIEDLEGVAVNRTNLTEADNGQALVWDNTANAYIPSPPGFDSLRLGGGMEVIYSVADLSTAPFINIILDEATHKIDQFDEIIIVLDGANTTLAIELSADGGTSPANLEVYQRSNSTSYSLLTRVKAGPNVDNSAGTAALARITGYSLPSFPTMVDCFGSSTGGSSSTMTQVARADTLSRMNAITLYMTGGLAATSGSLYVLGVKKSRQPLEFSAKRTTAWTAATALSETPTQGVKFRAGTIGTVVLDAAPGADTVFEVKDVAGTVYATATVLAAGTSADFVAATDGTITDEVQIIGTGAAGTATTARISIRGELA